MNYITGNTIWHFVPPIIGTLYSGGLMRAMLPGFAVIIFALTALHLQAAESETVRDSVYDLPPFVIVGNAVVDETTIRENATPTGSPICFGSMALWLM